MLGLPTKPFKEVADEFIAAKEAAGISLDYRRSLRHYLARLKRDFGPQPLADITTLQVDDWLREAHGNHTTKNNLRRIFVTLFKWAREAGYLAQDTKTAPERAMTFNGPELAPAIFTPAEIAEDPRRVPGQPPAAHRHRRVLRHPRRRNRAARLERRAVGPRLHRDQGGEGEDQSAAARAAPAQSARVAGADARRTEGRVCFLPNLHFRLNYLGEKSGVGWRQNALRHSFASYRLAETPDAAKVALEMGNTPDKLFRHYRELVTPEAAKEWFAIMPPAEIDVTQVA